jgi:ubiquinone/menaquinone biosynthesis C-methylase UbiE
MNGMGILDVNIGRERKTSISLRGFLKLNHDLCMAMRTHFPHTEADIFGSYEETVVRHIHFSPGQLVIDIGGGKTCPFAGAATGTARPRIVAVDISGAELLQNQDVSLKVVGDLMGRMPLGNEVADLIVSRSVLEHLKDVNSFVSECFRVLKRGGYTIHLFPSKFAPFAVLNQLLPNAVSKRLLHFFFPSSKGICGFPAYYDRCYFSGMKSLLKRNGFRVVSMEVNFSQSTYYSFFAPFYLLSTLYEVVIHKVGIKNLSAFVLVVAQKT